MLCSKPGPSRNIILQCTIIYNIILQYTFMLLRVYRFIHTNCCFYEKYTCERNTVGCVHKPCLLIHSCLSAYLHGNSYICMKFHWMLYIQNNFSLLYMHFMQNDTLYVYCKMHRKQCLNTCNMKLYVCFSSKMHMNHSQCKYLISSVKY